MRHIFYGISACCREDSLQKIRLLPSVDPDRKVQNGDFWSVADDDDDNDDNDDEGKDSKDNPKNFFQI